ncbi:MAG TPA: hypothetical protein VK939_14290 [Longimicrobiales bacterium]|nr:hypothetical protein [Longimicrobiales bacterium]
MKRREFIGIAAAGAGLLAVPVGLAATASFERAAGGIILRNLDYLRHDPAGLARFIGEYFAAADATQRLKVRLLYRLGRDAASSETIRDMVETYLMGSDFFSAGMDESRTVTFARIFSPYRGGCANPFAMINYPRDAERG